MIVIPEPNRKQKQNQMPHSLRTPTPQRMGHPGLRAAQPANRFSRYSPPINLGGIIFAYESKLLKG
jgi:hypothetical protein